VAAKASFLLNELERLKDTYGAETTLRKEDVLRELDRRSVPSARDVLRLHEVLCFQRAYPDSPTVLRQVERMLDRFSDRSDLRRHRSSLADSGIAGTTIDFGFFWPTARWLARRWPQQLHLVWRDYKESDKLLELLPLLLPYSELGGFEELDFGPRDWIESLKGPSETDATWLVRRIDSMQGDAFVRESIHDGLDLLFRLQPGSGAPSRTHAKYAPAPVTYQKGPLRRSRPSLRDEVTRPPCAVHTLSPREGRKLIELARAAMVTRARDLDVFAYGDRNDVRLVDFGDGLQFACIGFIPERRLLLHAVYGFLTLKNGVPIGYVLASALYGAAEVAYNTFETYRGAEAAFVFSRVLAMVRHLFGAEAFAIDPYQLGYGNLEGLKSGAWWFYYKLGFRPHDPEVLRVVRRELRRMQKNPRHRSNLATLRKLASEYAFLDLNPRRREWDLPPLWNVSLGISRYLAERFGSKREEGIRTCAREAAEKLGLRSLRGFSAAERQAWARWSPLIMALADLERWSSSEKTALVQVVRAKGGRHESDFVRLFDGHGRLQRAVLQLAQRQDS
jgi:hypothetical protein